MYIQGGIKMYKKEKKHSGSNIFVKITAGILAALMVVSVGGTLVYYLIGM